MAEYNRFQIVYEETTEFNDSENRRILVDTETGVNYLCWKCGYAGGITPLLDVHGNVVVTNPIK